MSLSVQCIITIHFYHNYYENVVTIGVVHNPTIMTFTVLWLTSIIVEPSIAYIQFLPEQPGHNTRPHARLLHNFVGMDDLTIDRNFSLQATRVIHVLGLFSDMLSTGCCTTRHLQTSCPLVQELNVCTVLVRYWQCVLIWYYDI